MEIKEHIKELYLSDTIPWIVGYSGGKDSTAVLQLIWETLSELDKSQLHKEVHVLTNDTLVENLLFHYGSMSHLKTSISKQRDKTSFRYTYDYT